MTIRSAFIASAVVLSIAAPALAGDAAWPDLKHALFGDQLLTPAGRIVEIDAPYRTSNDARTQLAGTVAVPLSYA